MPKKASGTGGASVTRAHQAAAVVGRVGNLAGDPACRHSAAIPPGARSPPVRGRWSLLSLVALVVICAGLAQTSRGHALLRDAGLYKVPTSYTELAFTNSDALPDAPTAKGQVPVSFSVHNVSGSSSTYQWSIAVTRDGKSQVKATGTVGVPAQGRATVTKSVTAECGTAPSLQVAVRLASPAESIDFWVSCPSGTPTAGAKG